MTNGLSLCCVVFVFVCALGQNLDFVFFACVTCFALHGLGHKPALGLFLLVLLVLLNLDFGQKPALGTFFCLCYLCCLGQNLDLRLFLLVLLVLLGTKPGLGQKKLLPPFQKKKKKKLQTVPYP
jgi:hypothetical protein